jgi:hypothetical protein
MHYLFCLGNKSVPKASRHRVSDWIRGKLVTTAEA